ncbi:glucose-6-phosphate isomerase [Anaerotignum propionicum]|uniref:glucose-6-phosphate isomerase n=1 Tax=Anaerotignum propionicum TaxID=28446 RepID=UPI00210AAD25|nr:glucose-6-phosphate isomerase [Anaerotignum propionicum]MCQ4936131.1 glucose-6-phosphate isomerase [Anaerotignum propionicum]
MGIKFTVQGEAVQKTEIFALSAEVRRCHEALHNKTGRGNDFVGWVDLPEHYNKEEFARIKKAATKIREDSSVLIVIGIGGSYLGTRTALDFIKSPYYNQLKKDTPEIYFAGNNISSAYLNDILQILGDRDFSINVISKSGTTTEPAIAFRIFKQLLEKKYGNEGAAKRIYATTDEKKGALKEMCNEQGYETFVIPDDIGGRFTVLTAVGLLAMAVAGVDIDAVMDGAKAAMEAYGNPNIQENECYQYAAMRHLFYKKGKNIEILANYDPHMTSFGEWYKQLFGESEGKEGKGIFPVSANFSTDLHSFGQFIQEGGRYFFETVLWSKEPKTPAIIPYDEADGDGLNFLAGKEMQFVNQKAFRGTMLAHMDGGVPNMVVEIDRMDEWHFGALIYFFEKAVGISGYLLEVNPFDQPGVEAYKKNMFALLGKPGYEELKAVLENRLAD